MKFNREEKCQTEIVMIVGNGFNHFVKNYVNNNNYHAQIIDKLKKSSQTSYQDKIFEKWLIHLRNLLNNYCNLLEPISVKASNVKGEYFLSELDSFCDVIHDTNSIIMDSIEKLIAIKIATDMNGDDKFPSKPVYTVRSIFKLYENSKYQGFYEKIDAKLKEYKRNMKIFTTNYDNFVDNVFTLKEENPENVIHIHGMYKDKDSIICCSPKKKKKKAKNKIAELEKYLDSSKTIILFGIGLDSDPHIVEALNKQKEKQFIIINDDPSEFVHSKLLDLKNYRFLENNELYLLSTDVPFINESHQLDTIVDTPEKLYDRLTAQLNL